MKTPQTRTIVLSAAIAFAIGCGSSEAPIRPVVKQEIPPDRKLKKLDLDQKSQGGLSGN
jgi:hypothetical protein